MSVYSITINILLVVLFSCFYAGLVLKPDDISQNLAKMAYSIPGIRQGKDTTKYLEKTVARLAFMGGLFLAFLAFFPLIIGNVLQVNIFFITESGHCCIRNYPGQVGQSGCLSKVF